LALQTEQKLFRSELLAKFLLLHALGKHTMGRNTTTPSQHLLVNTAVPLPKCKFSSKKEPLLVKQDSSAS